MSSRQIFTESYGMFRQQVNIEIERVFKERFSGLVTLPNVSYHMKFDNRTFTEESTISHSKRLRGVLFLLIADDLGVEIAKALPVACAIELYHNASLILDDIQDESQERCDQQALWLKIGTGEAINTAMSLMTVADLLLLEQKSECPFYSTAHQTLKKVALSMVEGQTLDLQAKQHWYEGVGYYFKMTELKTGALLAAACELATFHNLAWIKIQAFREFGYTLGIAHQLEDDIDDLVLSFTDRKLKLEDSSIGHFLAAELNIAFLDTNSLPKGGIFWQRLQSIRVEKYQRARNALSALQLSTSTRTILATVVDQLCCRNDELIAEKFVPE